MKERSEAARGGGGSVLATAATNTEHSQFHDEHVFQCSVCIHILIYKSHLVMLLVLLALLGPTKKNAE